MFRRKEGEKKKHHKKNEVRKTLFSIHILSDATTFFHNLYSLSPVAWRQRRALHGDGYECIFLWFTVCARSKRVEVVRLLLGLLLLLFGAMIALLVAVISSSALRRFWDVKGVALAVAEVVGDLLAVAAVLADFLLEWLCLAPVLLQQLFLGDY